jgi:antirestriction protein ArdC
VRKAARRSRRCPPPPPKPGLIEPTVEALIKATGIDFRIGGSRAFYAPAQDYVQVPPQAYFEPINWHRTALHELGHASGAPHRLNRDLSGPIGSKKYAFEELVAEINAAFCCTTLGIVPTVRMPTIRLLAGGAARRQSRHRPRASQASKAADFPLPFFREDQAKITGSGETFESGFNRGFLRRLPFQRLKRD